jgi:hypothetical protein
MAEPMREEVQEVVDFALKGDFLFGSEPPEGLDLKVVSNWPKDLLDAGPDGKDYNDLKDGDATFGGIRETEGAKVYGVLSRNIEMNKQSCKLERLLTGRKGVYERLSNQLPSWFDPDGVIAEVIVGDILSCSQHRVAFGRGDAFWDRVFEIYKSGGMPVGWSGKYPQGRLMAIYPGL